jgi:murein tripeptide amidase MpaA
MPRYHVTITGPDVNAMADLVRRHAITVGRHTLDRLSSSRYTIHAHVDDRQIRALQSDGYIVRRREDVDKAGKQRQREVGARARVRRPAGAGGAYLSVEEVEAFLAAAAAPPNDGFTQLIELPKPTWEGRRCHALKIARGGGQRRGIYFLGGVHAREWGGSDILINVVQEVAAAYRTSSGIRLGGKRFTAAQIQSVVESKNIYVFPQANPDGRHFSMTGDPMWRKNRRSAPGGGDTGPRVGVDINRNYPFLWDYRTHFAPTAPIQNSTDPASDVYIGPAPMSEPETQNAVWMFDMFPDIAYFVDVHSFGEDILYSWGDDKDQTRDPAMSFQNPAFDGKRGIVGDTAYREYILSSDRETAVTLARRMRDAIKAVRGRSYTVEQSVGLYPTAGTSDDYAYSRHIALTRPKVYAYTLEWGRETNPTPFHPPYAEMRKIIDEVTAGLLEFCIRAA